MFLQYPPTSMQLAIENMFFEIIDVLANVERGLFFTPTTQANIISAIASFQESGVMVLSAARCNHAVRATVNFLHPFSLFYKVATRPLYHA